MKNNNFIFLVLVFTMFLNANLKAQDNGLPALEVQEPKAYEMPRTQVI